MKTQRPESRKSRQRTGPAIVYGAVPAVLLASFLASGVARSFQGNWSALFYFGDAWVDGGALPRDPIVREGPGYDGQFYYRVARDPLLPFARLRSDALSDPVPGIGTAWYRYRRIAYPLTARFAAVGTVDAPYLLPITVAALWSAAVAVAFGASLPLGALGALG